MHCNGWSGSLRRTPAIIHEYCIVAKPKFSLEFNEGILRVRPLSSHLILHLPGNIPRSLLYIQQITLQSIDAIGDGHTCKFSSENLIALKAADIPMSNRRCM